jgi:hypothetical protein
VKLKFSDIFNENEYEWTAKKNIRLGALIIPENHPFSPNDPRLGVSLSDWKTNQFDVDIDHDCIVITRIIPPAA